MAWEITEQKRAEARFRQLLEHSPNAVACHRMLLEDGVPRDFLVLDVNPKFRELTGLSDAAGKRQSALAGSIYPFSAELFAAGARVAATGEPERLEVACNNGEQWISCALYSPEPGYFMSVKEDVTERRQLADTLRQALSVLKQGSAPGAALQQIVQDAQAVLERRINQEKIRKNPHEP
jgi:PAS domain-containing protein